METSKSNNQHSEKFQAQAMTSEGFSLEDLAPHAITSKVWLLDFGVLKSCLVASELLR